MTFAFEIHIGAAFFPILFIALGFVPYLLAQRRVWVYKNVKVAGLHSLILWAVALGIVIGLVVGDWV